MKGVQFSLPRPYGHVCAGCFTPASGTEATNKDARREPAGRYAAGCFTPEAAACFACRFIVCLRYER
jgi:hypothetical protein